MLNQLVRYNWQRDCVPFSQPKLHFDCHFQNDGLPIPPHAHLLVAVSGGSDSIALLHLLHEWKVRTKTPTRINVATVDHTLRPESEQEARGVAEACANLGFVHKTLVWTRERGSKITSSDARNARYRLLIDHAETIGATCLCLGHTMDDQAETVFMRSLRGGGVRGLSGMTVNSMVTARTDPLAIHRPLLAIRRERLRDWLREKGVEWIEDPTNNNTDSERIRIRRYLQNGDTRDVENIARLADHSARHRAWLASEAAKFVTEHLVQNDDDTIRFAPCDTPYAEPIITEALSATIQHLTTAPYRVPAEKLVSIAKAWANTKPLRFAIGGILLANSRAGLVLSAENRTHNLPKLVPNAAHRITPSPDYPLDRALSRIRVQHNAKFCRG